MAASCGAFVAPTLRLLSTNERHRRQFPERKKLPNRGPITGEGFLSARNCPIAREYQARVS
jgi:hypothetical protein